MGLLGHMLGGALQGAGQGITNQAIAARQESLEALRQRFQTQREDAAYERTKERDKTQHEYSLDSADAQYRNQAGLLAIGGQVQERRDQRQHVYSMEEIKTKGVQAQEMARLESQLAQGRTAAEIKLRDQLESGDVKSVVKGADGTYYGVTEKGLISTGIAAAPDAASGGGKPPDLTEGEIDSLYQDARRAWIQGGKKGPEPTRTQFITKYKMSGAAPDAKPAPRRGGGVAVIRYDAKGNRIGG